MDLDIHGPNVPKMLGLEDHQLLSDCNKIVPVRVSEKLQVVSMAFLLPHRNSPVIWRGPMKSNAIRQFLVDTAWEPLDSLIVDLPQGTGDEPRTIRPECTKSHREEHYTISRGILTSSSITCHMGMG